MTNIKIKLESIINDIDNNEKNVYNLEGTAITNKIDYNDGIYNNELTYDKIPILHRFNEEVDYMLIFDITKTTETKYTLKNYGRYINIEITTKSVKISNNLIRIEYTQKIEDINTNYEYILRWEEI